ncbi:hypothetical protein ACRC7T_01725 [Segnochrobactraceae bacterium EtOH-i3]
MSAPVDPTPAETAGYIHEMCGQMRELAARSGFRFLAYLLDMAGQEASACKTPTQDDSRSHPAA